MCVKFSLRHTIWFFHFFESHAEHFVQSEWRLEFASIAATERPSWNDKIWCVQENDAVLIVGWCYPPESEPFANQGSKCAKFLGSNCRATKFWKIFEVLTRCPSVYIYYYYLYIYILYIYICILYSTGNPFSTALILGISSQVSGCRPSEACGAG